MYYLAIYYLLIFAFKALFKRADAFLTVQRYKENPEAQAFFK
jgi:hypothetical protein